MTFSRTHRFFSRLAAAAVVAVMALSLSSVPASAHDVLISSNPADGAVLDTAPESVSFTFDQPIQNYEPVLNVFGPNGNSFAASEPQIVGPTVSADFDAGPAGDYRAVFRIVSSDGHPITGQIIFTLAESAAGDAVGIPADDDAGDTHADVADSASANTEESSGSQLVLWIIGSVLVAIMLGMAIMYAVRPKNRPGR